MSAVTFSRISFLSRLAVCPSAWAESEGKPSIKSEPSARGDGFHDYMAGPVDDVHDDEAAYLAARELASKHMCDEGALLDLIQKNTFDPDGGERELPVVLKIPAGDGCPEIHVPGTADWVKVKDGSAVVVDYKTSAFPDHAIPITRDLQLHGYAVAVADQYGVDRVTAIKYYPALGEEGYETCEVDLEDARKRLAYVVRRAWRGTNEYRPNNIDWSTGCKGCPGVVSCDAVRFEMTRALRLLGHDQPNVTTQNAREVYESLRLLGAAQKFKPAASSALVELIDATGPIPMDDTHEIRVVESGKARYPQACRKEVEK